jgi:hypothetical protein
MFTMALWNTVPARQTLRAPQENKINNTVKHMVLGTEVSYPRWAHNNAVCVTINHKSTTVDVPTIEGPSSDGMNFD